MQRWSTWWLVGAILALAVGCREGLYHDLEEQAANEIVAGLHEAGIDARKVGSRAGWAVEVPQGSTATAVRALEQRGLPRAVPDGLEATYEGSIVPSPLEDHARFQHATALAARRSLLTIEGVVDAQVNLVLPPPRRSSQPAEPAKASVVLKVDHRGDPPITVADVKRAVAASVAGLEPDAVEVLVTQTRPAGDEPAASLVSVGPITVPAASRATAQLMFAAPVFVSLVLGFLLLWNGRRRR